MNELELARHLINDLGIDKDKVAVMLRALKQKKSHSQILVEVIDDFFNEHTEMTEEDYSSAIYTADQKFNDQEEGRE